MAMRIDIGCLDPKVITDPGGIEIIAQKLDVIRIG
jgi:hypothetical protein